MKLRAFGAALGVALVAAGVLLASSGVASAHERRNVGAFTFVVGWLNEPALLNQPNAATIAITRTADSSPVEGAEKTLKLEMTAGTSEKLNTDLSPRFRMPGNYEARVIPTKTGSYVFKFTGTIEGIQVNETFTAGPGTFGLIEEGKAFPTELTSSQELDESVAALQQRVAELEADSGGSNSGMTFGIIGIIVGAAGLAVGGYGLMRKAG